MSMKLDITAPEECERMALSVTRSFASRLKDYHQCAVELIGDGVKMSDVVMSAMDRHMKADRDFQRWLKKRDAEQAQQDAESDDTPGDEEVPTSAETGSDRSAGVQSTDSTV